MLFVENEQIPKINIYQKILYIQSRLETVAKNLEISTGKNSYKAVSERDVIDAVKREEGWCRIVSFPTEREIVESGILEQETNYGIKKSFYIRLRVVYRFVNIDNPSEYIETIVYADGIDSGDKATGKAMTYADKYALMKMYKISTGEDPDQKASEEYTKKIPSQTPITIEAMQQIQSLYSSEEIQKMLANLKLSDISKLKMSQANKMILARTGINDQTETY